MKIKRDVNGNKILVVTGKDLGVSRGFSVQTLGNLPLTHKYGIADFTGSELFEYVKSHGTIKQKNDLHTNKEFTLRDIKDQWLNDRPFIYNLTENDIDQLTDLLCKGCRSNTYKEIRRSLSYVCDYNGAWFFDCIVWNFDRWVYVASQDYTLEISEIRRLLMK